MTKAAETEQKGDPVAMGNQQVATQGAGNAALPDFLKGRGKTASQGNIDKTDLILPRVKLLQSISPEITEQNNPNAKAGQFWHTLAGEPMGDRLRFVPLVTRKTIALWAPRGDTRGILARSSDCENWDPGFENLEFELKFKKMPKPIKVNTGPNVAGSFVVSDDPAVADLSLIDFGTSVPGDQKSAPIASLTYNLLMFFPDFADISPAVVINTRSAVRRAKDLISKIEMRPVDHFAQMFEMYTTDEQGDEGPYKGYAYTAKGYVESEAMLEHTQGLYEKFKDESFSANDEGADVPEGGGGAAPVKDSGSKKF